MMMMCVSIPFIAGQWSLPTVVTSYDRQALEFQSPSLRGSGRFVYLEWDSRLVVAEFQSPSLRGSGRFVGVV